MLDPIAVAYYWETLEMPKDLKIGYLIGLVLVSAAAVFIATRSQLSTRARMLQTPKTVSITDTTDTQAEQKPPKYLKYWQREKIKTQKFHIVRRGDTLTSISLKYYGRPNQWEKILNTNKNTIKNPEVLTPGAKIIIPD